MQNKSILTAIIFTYNHKDSIAKCIDSVVQQDTDYNYEIHIWDDCSIDGTSDICREYADKYPEKIQLFIQNENTFLKPYLELQSYSAIKNINTKYFCVIDGDDYWCDNQKIQIAIDFLEKNDEYIGFAHDTLQVDKFRCESKSYIHELIGWDVKNHVSFDVEMPFFLTSSRVFRNIEYAQERVLPIDYLIYYYHLSQGPVYYYDKIMAAYVIGENNTFATLGNIKDLNGMFAYKLSILFDFKQDDFCTQLQKKYDVTNGVGLSRYNRLLLFKKIFGVQLGWKLWFMSQFVIKYGLDSMDVNYVYSRELAKQKADQLKVVKDDKELARERRVELQAMIEKETRRVRRLRLLMSCGMLFTNSFRNKLEDSMERKYERLAKWTAELSELPTDEQEIKEDNV